MQEWKELAARLANRIANELFEAQRGVLLLGEQFILFGNDGYSTDQRSRMEVQLLRQQLNDLGFAEFGISTDVQGYTWAMIVTPPPLDGAVSATMDDLAVFTLVFLWESLWQAWSIAWDCLEEEGVHRKIAATVWLLASRGCFGRIIKRRSPRSGKGPKPVSTNTPNRCGNSLRASFCDDASP